VLPESSETWVKLAMIGLMLRRLTGESVKWKGKKQAGV
jgi:hypothetical protein